MHLEGMKTFKKIQDPDYRVNVISEEPLQSSPGLLNDHDQDPVNVSKSNDPDFIFVVPSCSG